MVTFRRQEKKYYCSLKWDGISLRSRLLDFRTEGRGDVRRETWDGGGIEGETGRRGDELKMWRCENARLRTHSFQLWIKFYSVSLFTTHFSRCEAQPSFNFKLFILATNKTNKTNWNLIYFFRWWLKVLFTNHESRFLVRTHSFQFWIELYSESPVTGHDIVSRLPIPDSRCEAHKRIFGALYHNLKRRVHRRLHYNERPEGIWA